MQQQRRKILLSASAATVFGFLCLSCKPVEKYSERKKGLPVLTSPSADELQFLSNVDIRRSKHAGTIVKITGRSFGGEMRFDDFMWENMEFENCDFINCLMRRGMMRNVRFVNCLFFSNTWQDRSWEDVAFRGCAWRGPFKMGAGRGDGIVQFKDCEFAGATGQELGYGGKSEYFGSIGGAIAKISFHECNFERISVHGGRSVEFRNVNMVDVIFYGEEESEFSLENVTASGLIDLGNNCFSIVKIKKGTFAKRLTFNGAKIGSAIFDEVKANLDLTLVKAGSILLNHVTFLGAAKPTPQFQYGLTCESSKIKSLTLENCSFEGFGAELHLSGEEMVEELMMESSVTSENVYSTDIQELVIRSTPIINGHFKYMRISKLTLEDLRITSADFSRSVIGYLITNNVTTAEGLRLGKVKIYNKNASNLSFGSSV